MGFIESICNYSEYLRLVLSSNKIYNIDLEKKKRKLKKTSQGNQINK